MELSNIIFRFNDIKMFTIWVCENGFYYDYDDDKFIFNPYSWVMNKIKLKTFKHYKEYTFEELYNIYNKNK